MPWTDTIVANDVNRRAKKYISNYDFITTAAFEENFIRVTQTDQKPVDVARLNNFFREGLMSRITTNTLYGYLDSTRTFHKNESIVFPDITNNYKTIDIENYFLVPYQKCFDSEPNVKFCDIAKIQNNQPKIANDGTLNAKFVILSKNFEDAKKEKSGDRCHSISKYASGVFGFGFIRIDTEYINSIDELADIFDKIYRGNHYWIDKTPGQYMETIEEQPEKIITYRLYDVNSDMFPKIEKLSLATNYNKKLDKLESGLYKRLLYDDRVAYMSGAGISNRDFLAPGLTTDIFAMHGPIVDDVINLFLNVGKSLAAPEIKLTLFDFNHMHVSYNFKKDQFVFIFHTLEYPADLEVGLVCHDSSSSRQEMTIGSEAIKYPLYRYGTSPTDYVVKHNIIVILTTTTIEYYRIDRKKITNGNLNSSPILKLLGEKTEPSLAINPSAFGYQFADINFEDDTAIGRKRMLPSIAIINRNATCD
ncbi:MAG: hypothetical protein Hyperionvirus1_151 [Hyperionvirus sp.]|uniref:Uncharacterized protein n=1 Tax=Hyperionvirus sp. TaxID=2487770 RepID=A0A3G5A6C1_9VIRU|nr:MAG: hypothetical protein Hyperionvirus1_151 [Hyperionvirus sp.]